MQNNTLRLLMPQWQGGNNPPYSFGAKLLRWLAPDPDGMPEIEVPVEPYDGKELPLEDGVRGRTVLMRQLRSASAIINEYQPDRIIMFGGDCLVSQAPFTYLNERYGGKLGVLWIDAHPDISTPAMHQNAHAMVLGNLLSGGDPGFAAEVKRPLSPGRVIYAGLQKPGIREQAEMNNLGLTQVVDPKEAERTSKTVLRFIEEHRIRQLAIHLDLDVLSPNWFRSLLPSEPVIKSFPSALGEMTLQGVRRLIQDVSKKTDVVGLSIAEHLPWDAMNLHYFLGALPIFEG